MSGPRIRPDGLLESCCWSSWLEGRTEGYVEGYLAGRADLQQEIHDDAHAVVQAMARMPVVDGAMTTATSEQIALAAHDREARGIARFRADHERRRQAVVA